MPRCKCGEWVLDGNHLRDHMQEEHPEGFRRQPDNQCPQCGSQAVREGRCLTCRECAWEKCGGARV